MLIGINGFKGVGKDTAGAYIVEKYGYKKLSFAAKLKESAAALFDANPNIWEEWKNLSNARIALFKSLEDDYTFADDNEIYFNISVREFLQRYGTEAHRDIFGTDFWVDHALKGINPNQKYLFTDARFQNELERIRGLGGVNLRIERDLEDYSETHASEVEPPDYLIDYIIYNGGDFDELYESIDGFMEWIKVEQTANQI